MVYPLMALFLGTGNQTPNVSSAILERLFTDKNMRLWDYSPDTLLPNLPKMYTFPNLHDFYKDWRKDLEGKGVEIRTSHELVRVLRRDAHGVTIESRKVGSDNPLATTVEHYDELVMAVLADDAKQLLGKQSGWMERNVLGSAAFFDDITVTHNDAAYFKDHYETSFKPELVMKGADQKFGEQVSFAKDNFRPMYYTYSYDEDPTKIEMSFDCSAYQHQFPKDDNLDKHVFQTIFLDKANEKTLWTREEIAKDKVICEKWWHQLGHRWQHYLQVVPWMMFLNGKNHTWFAGSWTLVNMHELACVSGLAVAYRLGSTYPFPDDEFASSFFKMYLLLSHGKVYKK